MERFIRNNCIHGKSAMHHNRIFTEGVKDDETDAKESCDWHVNLRRSSERRLPHSRAWHQSASKTGGKTRSQALVKSRLDVEHEGRPS